MQGANWEETEEYGDARLERCPAFMPVPGPLQKVQRAEFWPRLWLFKPTGLGIWVWITSGWFGLLLGCLVTVACPSPYFSF